MEQYLRNDPKEIEALLNKKVLITCKSKTNYVGTVYTIDPVSLTFVIVSSSDSENDSQLNRLQFIISENITSVKVIDDNDEDAQNLRSCMKTFINSFAGKSSKSNIMTEEEMTRRKKIMISWFNEKNIPVEEKKSEVLIAGTVRVKEPYECCLCPNDVLLSKFTQMIQQIITMY